jgi:archaellum component FlaC
MKQLEEVEEDTNKLKGERDGVKRSEIETKSKIEALKFENELLKKRLESGTKDKSDAHS